MQFAKEQQIDLNFSWARGSSGCGIVDALLAKVYFALALHNKQSTRSLQKLLQRLPTRISNSDCKICRLYPARTCHCLFAINNLCLLSSSSGLAAGKGVVIAQTYAEAEEANPTC